VRHLNREKIETEALALIETEGLEGFSTRKLGQALGCEAMSIYYHFPSKAHLLDALVDRTLSSLPTAPKTLSPGQSLRHMAQAWRTMARERPRFYLWMALHRWNSEVGVRFLAEVLACFHAAGLKPEQAARGFRVLGYYLLGATLDENSGYAHGPSAIQPMPDADVKRLHPQVAQAGRFFSPAHFDATFELGLTVLLQGLGVED
jgi:AcrR family transcriptional regulator